MKNNSKSFHPVPTPTISDNHVKSSNAVAMLHQCWSNGAPIEQNRAEQNRVASCKERGITGGGLR